MHSEVDCSIDFLTAEKAISRDILIIIRVRVRVRVEGKEMLSGCDRLIIEQPRS